MGEMRKTGNEVELKSDRATEVFVPLADRHYAIVYSVFYIR